MFFNVIFLVYIFFVLSFGRAFCLLHIGPIFISEVVLLFGTILLLGKFKKIMVIPNIFLIALTTYFIYGCIHLAIAFYFGGFLCLKDSVFVSYVLLLPFTFLTFPEKKYFRTLIFVIALGSLLGLSFVSFCIYRTSALNELFGRIKAFHYSLYILITLSFMVPTFSYIKKRIIKLFILMLCAFNLYILFIWPVRSSWIALTALSVFLILVIDFKSIIKFTTYCIFIFVLLALLASKFIDYSAFKRIIYDKVTSFSTFVTKDILSNKDDLYQKSKHELRSPDLEVKKYKDYEAKLYANVYKENSNDINKEFYIMNFANIIWRFSLWNMGIISATAYPIFGKGLGKSITVRTSTNAIAGLKTQPLPFHNHIISIFYKFGIVGLFLFLFVNFYSFMYGINYIREIKDSFLKIILIGSLGGFISWHMLALFFDVIDSTPTSIFLWILIGMIFACVNIDKNEKNKTIENPKREDKLV